MYFHTSIEVGLLAQHMWTEKFDLHSHSTNSDGQHPVEDVAHMMSESNVRYWSLTDHDTISGWDAAQTAAEVNGMVFIPGVEITCMPGLPAESSILELRNQERTSDSWHLLAYFPSMKFQSEQHRNFQAWLAPLGEGRIPRMLTMIGKLGELGMPVDFDAVIARAGGSVGRPHLADEMMALGYIETRQEAFDKWIGDGKPAHISRPQPSITDACAAVHAAGGITSLAHPFYYCIDTDALVAFCLQSDVDAIECFHRSHSDAYRFELWSAAKDSGLSVTCGSDFHGTQYNQTPGHMAVPIVTLPASLKTSL
jgi:predicted metal-dependent phosphoesterase TrpH